MQEWCNSFVVFVITGPNKVLFISINNLSFGADETLNTQTSGNATCFYSTRPVPLLD